MIDEITRYSDADLAEFKEIIQAKIKKAQGLHACAQLMDYMILRSPCIAFSLSIYVNFYVGRVEPLSAFR